MDPHFGVPKRLRFVAPGHPMPHPEFRAATFCGSKDPKVLAAPAAAPAFLKSPGRPMDPMAMAPVHPEP